LNDNTFHRLTDQTIHDIDFHALFAFVDRTTSRVGQQFLFKKLLEPAANKHDPAKQLVELFASDQKLREEVQVELLELSDTDAYNIPSLLKNELLERPRWLKLLPFNIAILAILLLVSIKIPVFISFAVVPLMVNMMAHYANKSNAFMFISSFPQLNLLINTSRALSKKHKDFYHETVTKSISDLKSFQRSARFINFDTGGGIQAELNQVGNFFAELIKGLFLIEVFTFFHVLKALETKQQSIITLFNYVGNIDTAISIAGLRAGSQKTCEPVITSEQKEIVAKNVYHPLIKKCTPNDLTISGKSVLITGSNMSGKSTFLRTMTINSILAQTIHTCFADEFITPALKQFSSIRIDDDINEGKSYFFEEVKIMGTLLNEVESGHQNLFVLDEVFKGTNTIERVAAAKAILSYLNTGNNIVIISTHDVELASMLTAEYDLYHFTEIIEEDKLQFDHTIKPGPVKTRNAIRILELLKYPPEIIKEARMISESREPGTWN
jgi:DNA mismatch repair ATPase MutS